MINRNGYNVRIWQVNYIKNGFKFPIFIKGTEPEMQAYMESEMGYVGEYWAVRESDEDAIHRLKLSIYLAPKL